MASIIETLNPKSPTKPQQEETLGAGQVPEAEPEEPDKGLALAREVPYGSFVCWGLGFRV